MQADDLRHMRDTVLGLIAEDTGQPVERIFEDSLHDRWYTAQEAREYGFIDHIVDGLRPGHAAAAAARRTAASARGGGA